MTTKIICTMSARSKSFLHLLAVLTLMVVLAWSIEVLDLIVYCNSLSTLYWLVFAIACFLCFRYSSAVIRVGWQGWFTSALGLCALQQPSLPCSAQRPSWFTLSEASSSPDTWRKEHETLLCKTILLRAGSEGLCLLHRSVWKKVSTWVCWKHWYWNSDVDGCYLNIISSKLASTVKGLTNFLFMHRLFQAFLQRASLVMKVYDIPFWHNLVARRNVGSFPSYQ